MARRIDDLSNFGENSDEDPLLNYYIEVIQAKRNKRTIFQQKQGLYFIYSGELNEEGLPDGQGVAKYIGLYKGQNMNMVKYIGEWKDGNEHGLGVLTKEGSEFIFEGEHKEGLANGYGVRIGREGDKYEGFWRDGKKDRQGTYVAKDGSIYVGEWKDDERHGRGVRRTIYGETFDGEWRNNRFFTGIHKKYVIRGDQYPEEYVIKKHKAELEGRKLFALMNKLAEENRLRLGTKEDIGEMLVSVGYPPLNIKIRDLDI